MTEKECIAFDAILDELERRRQLRMQNGGILSSVCQNTEDVKHERNGNLRPSVNGGAGKEGI